jgi:hypothetical protein
MLAAVVVRAIPAVRAAQAAAALVLLLAEMELLEQPIPAAAAAALDGRAPLTAETVVRALSFCLYQQLDTQASLQVRRQLRLRAPTQF